MPTDLLLPAFVLTLLANATLIAVAIQSLRREHADSTPVRYWTAPGPAPRPTSVPPSAALPDLAPDAEPIADARGPRPDATPTPIADAPDRAPDASPEPIADPPGPPPDATPTPIADAPDRAPDASPEPIADPPGPPPDATPAPITNAPGPPPDASPAPPTGAETRPRRARSAPGTTTRAARTGPAGAAPRPETPARRSRRKFSLPPLDDDHEKVNRSIKSFLAGADGAAAPQEKPMAARDAAAPVPAPSSTRPRSGSPATSEGVPTTIAIMTIAGIDDARAVLDELPGDGMAIDTVAMLEQALRHGNATDALALIEQAMDDGAATDALDMLERALRGAVRGGDEVHGPERGRFRIVLPATGELAARAYVRRIRAVIEPQLESAERPLRLVVATATALDVPIRTATTIAMRRLDAALAAHAEGATASTPIDGAGGDAETNGVYTPRTAGD